MNVDGRHWDQQQQQQKQVRTHIFIFLKLCYFCYWVNGFIFNSFSILSFWTPEGKRSYKIALVYVYVCNVCQSVMKINFVNFLKIGSYDFF